MRTHVSNQNRFFQTSPCAVGQETVCRQVLTDLDHSEPGALKPIARHRGNAHQLLEPLRASQWWTKLFRYFNYSGASSGCLEIMPWGSCRGKSSKEDLRICPSCASGALTALSQWKGKSLFVPKCRLFNWHQIFCVEIGVVLNCSSYLTRSCYETGCVQSVGLLIGFIQLKKLSCYRNGNSYIFLILLLGSWTGQLRINFSEDKRQWIKVRRHGCDFQTDQRPCVSHLLEA